MCLKRGNLNFLPLSLITKSSHLHLKTRFDFDFPVLNQMDVVPLGLHGCCGHLIEHDRGRPEGWVCWGEGNTIVFLLSLENGNISSVLRLENPKASARREAETVGPRCQAVLWPSARAAQEQIHLAAPQQQRGRRRGFAVRFALPGLHGLLAG